MDKFGGKLTVFFDDPFWVGVFEARGGGKMRVAKVTFGAEPKDFEVYQFILKHYCGLNFGPEVTWQTKEKKKNPKRIFRDVKKQLKNDGVGTKSQQAVKLQHEQNKQERKTKSREQKSAEEERLFQLKLQKKKQKHRGR